ncbi:MAG TPA: hypothetical protein VKA97_12665, partial [Pyrinomonadaceae bacterium]|nr:hypothetical protein [Pyrinomonadaceae bacterium]
MKTVLAVIVLLIGPVDAAIGQDITTLETIGPVTSVERTANAVTLHCRDNSQVQLTVLAPDLIRV